MEIVARITEKQARSLTRPFPRRHVLDFLLLAILFAIAVALFRDYRFAQKPVPLAGPGGIPPFHVIVPSDLRSDVPARREFAFSDFLGRYPTQYIKPGDKVVEKNLSSGRQLTSELDKRFLVRVKVQPTTLFSGVSPPFQAALLLAPRDRGTGSLTLNDVYVLDLQKEADGLATVISLRNDDETTFAAFTARSDFFLVVRQP